MAYNSSGGWDMEDDGVAKRIAAITTGNSDMMRQARTTGLQAANRRGLGNSSMAVGAGQAEVIRAAAPIASQEAQQTYGKNLQEQQGQISADQLTRQIAAAERQQLVASTTDLTGQSLSALAQTLQNDKIPAATRAAVQSSINDRIAQQQRYIQSLYGFAPATTALPPAAADATPGFDPALNISGGLSKAQFAQLLDSRL